MSEFIVVTGLSGAGRTEVANALEDLGWFVIDNLPSALIPKVGELAGAPGGSAERVALVVRSSEDLVGQLQELRSLGARVQIVFVDASTDVLVNRYESTRRRHPFPGDSLIEAIEGERDQLEPLKAAADLVIDTGELNVHDLRRRVVEAFSDDDRDLPMTTFVQSFGWKQGAPRDADIVLDCRFLPNPHWIDDLRPLTGLDEAVRDYVCGQQVAKEFLARVEHLLDLLLPAFIEEGKTHLTVAFGCTGGRHRSVAICPVLRKATDSGPCRRWMS